MTTWTQEPLTRRLAQHLRRDIRAHRREQGQNGHRYSFTDLKELYALRTPVGAVTHVVLTHYTDPAWLVFGWHVEQGWLLVDCCEGRQEAKEAAENHTWAVPDLPDELCESGLYVLAGRSNADDHVQYTVRVRCKTKNSAISIAEIFHKLGYETMREEIA